MAKLKQELGLDKAEVEIEGTFIENPEWKFWHGVNLDVDIKEEDMDEETRELNKLFDEDFEEEEEIDENFILNLNEGQKMIEERGDDDEETKVESNEEESKFGFMPPNLSDEAKEMLMKAR